MRWWEEVAAVRGSIPGGPSSRGLFCVVLAVKDLDAASRTYERLGFPIVHRGGREEWGLDATMLGLGWGMLELIAVADVSKPVAAKVDEFLRDRGEGVYMLSIGVADADAAHADLEANGVRAHLPVKAPAVDGFEASLLWLTPAQTHGVLLELIELESVADGPMQNLSGVISLYGEAETR